MVDLSVYDKFENTPHLTAMINEVQATLERSVKDGVPRHLVVEMLCCLLIAHCRAYPDLGDTQIGMLIGMLADAKSMPMPKLFKSGKQT